MSSSGRPYKQIYANELSEHIRPGNQRYVKENLSGANPLCFNCATGISALVTAGAAQVDRMVTMPRGIGWEIYQATAQALMPLGVAGGGLEIAGDQVENEEVEYVLGGNDTGNPYGNLIDTDPSWFFRAKLKVTTVAGSDQIALGFRKQQAYTAVPIFSVDGLYTDFAMFVLISGNLYVCTDLNNSGTAVATDTGFNWANGETHYPEIRMSGGLCSYLLNGVPLGQTVYRDGEGATITGQATVKPPAFTFDTGDFVVPMIEARMDAAPTTTIQLLEYECGPLSERGLNPNVTSRAK